MSERMKVDKSTRKKSTSLRIVKILLGAMLLGAAFAFWTNRHNVGNIMTEMSASTATTSALAKPLLHQMAPALFAMNTQTGLIDLPPNIDTVIVDVGARESDYMKMVEERAKLSDTADSIALILVDPLPDSIVPLQKSVAAYTSLKKDQRWLNSDYTKRVFAINAAMAEEEGHTVFNVGAGPACSSLLNTSNSNTFWCAKATEQIPVLMFTLRDLLALIPHRPGKITSMHLKVDAEGADLNVLRGAREAISRFDSVIIECRNDETNKLVYDGECEYKAARQYMLSQGFDQADAEGQGDLVNAYFWKKRPRGENATMSYIPDFLSKPPIVMRNLYQRMKT